MLEKFKENANTYLLVISALLTFFGFSLCVLLVIYAGWRLARKQSEKLNSLLYCGLAMSILSMFMIFPIVGISMEQMDVSLVLLAIVGTSVIGGVCLILMYRRFSREERLAGRCWWLIHSDHITSIARLAEILGLSPRQMRTLIETMLRTGRLEGASLPEDSDEIQFTRSIWAHQLVVCENCGAEFTVNFGHTLTCDYCGRALKVRRVS